MTDDAKFKTMFDACADLRARMVREHARSEEDLLMLASNMAFQAALIYRQLGGAEHVAQQFYAMADNEAAARPTPETQGG